MPGTDCLVELEPLRVRQTARAGWAMPELDPHFGSGALQCQQAPPPRDTAGGSGIHGRRGEDHPPQHPGLVRAGVSGIRKHRWGPPLAGCPARQYVPNSGFCPVRNGTGSTGETALENFR